MSPLPPDRVPSRAGRSLVLLALLGAGCHPPETGAHRAVRLASRGPHVPGPGGPPVSIVPGDRLPPPGTRLTCPVCGDEFVVENGVAVRHYKGKAVIFCCKRCLPHFDKNPDLFMGPGI